MYEIHRSYSNLLHPGAVVINLSSQGAVQQVYRMETVKEQQLYPRPASLGEDRFKVEWKFLKKSPSGSSSFNEPDLVGRALGFEVHSSDEVAGWHMSIVNNQIWWSQFFGGGVDVTALLREARDLRNGVIELVLFDSNPNYERPWLEQSNPVQE